MGTTKNDKANPTELQRWEDRKQELKQLIVVSTSLSHKDLPILERGHEQLDPIVYFPSEVWRDLKFHEKQWLRGEAAALSSRGAILVGRSAARKLGIWVVSRTAETVELTLPSRGSSPRRRSRGGFTYRCSKLRADEVLTYEGQRVTTPIRTFIDIARHHGFVEGLIAADYLLHRGKSRDEIERELRLMGPARGIAIARRCLKHAIEISQSAYESLARALLIEAGVEGVIAQMEIDGRFVDLCIDGWLLIEIDGDVKYDGEAGELAWRQEMARQKQIGNHGYVFLRYTPEFLLRHPEQFVDEVRSALESRRLLEKRIG